MRRLMLPPNAAAMGWDSALKDLGEFVRKGDSQLLSRFPDEAPDPFDLGGEADDGSASNKSNDPIWAQSQTKKAKQKTVEEAFRAFGPNPQAVAGSEDRALAQPDWTSTFQALMWHGSALYKTDLRVDPAGRVEMTGDRAVAGATELPLSAWQVLQHPADITLLCYQQPREEITAQRFYAQIKEHERESEPKNDGEVVAKAAPLRRLRITDKNGIKLSRKYDCRLEFEDVEFVGPVELDDGVFEHSLVFNNCRLLRHLSARNATVKGSFHLERTRIEGVTEDPKYKKFQELGDKFKEFGHRQPLAALDLSGLKVERGMLADQLLVHGRVNGRQLRVGDTLRMRGLRVRRRPGIDDRDDENFAVDLTQAVIGGSIDMIGQLPPQHGAPGERTRTRLGGDVCLNGVETRAIDLGGVRIDGDLHLSNSRIASGVSCLPLPLNRSEPASWRARIRGRALLDNARTGFLALNGCDIGDDLFLVGLYLEGSLRCDLHGGFRTKIANDLVLSGAKIVGDVSLKGAQVLGEIHFITGSCGRIDARCAFWPQINPNRQSAIKLLLHEVPVEASGVVLNEVFIGNSINLFGIKIHGKKPSFAKKSFLTKNMRVGGDLTFGTPQHVEYIEKGIKENLDEQPLWVLIRDSICFMDGFLVGAINSVRATIEGDIELRGARIEGSINLSHIKVRQLHLDNARIGGSIEVLPLNRAETCECSHFSARLANIQGDVNLCGLVVRPPKECDIEVGLDARDIEVGGIFSMCNQEQGPSAFYMKVSRGRIWLQGARAKQLILSGSSSDPSASGTSKATISLSRGRFGQLTILGFDPVDELRRFPAKIELAPIEVGDWDVCEQKEAYALLEQMEPFDGRVYVDMEGRLARVGYKRIADKMYRRMKWRQASHSSSRFLKVRTGWNEIFSRHGTWPWLMGIWLAASVVPVFLLLREPGNVEVTDPSKTPSFQIYRDWNWSGALLLAHQLCSPLPGQKLFGTGPCQVKLPQQYEPAACRIPLHRESCRWPFSFVL